MHRGVPSMRQRLSSARKVSLSASVFSSVKWGDHEAERDTFRDRCPLNGGWVDSGWIDELI